MVRRRIARLTCGATTVAVGALALVAAVALLGAAGHDARVRPASAVASGIAIGIALWPATAQYPRGVLRRWRRVLAGVALGVGAIGFAGHASLLAVPDAASLLAAGLFLSIALPGAYELGWRTVRSGRPLVVGDDARALGEAIAELDRRPIGYCAPPAAPGVRPPTDPSTNRPSDSSTDSETGAGGADADSPAAHTDGGKVTVAGGPRRERPVGARPGEPAVPRVGGLTELGDVVRDRGVDAVVIRFSRTDRAGVFGALRVCRAHGVDAIVHRAHASATAAARELDDDLVVADLEPIPWHGRLAKRGFDVAFASVGILIMAPVMTVIAVAIKLDSPGPVLYAQRRTGRLGETFQLLKFRSMVSDAEAGSGPRLSEEDAGGTDPRVTRVGRVLRATHLDELPQLFSVLVGEMSVVGPRPERPEIEAELPADVDWERRWFLTPGLTGLAQINGVTGTRPARKLAYDLEYRERQSLALDLRVVAVQVRQVLGDGAELLGRPGE